MDEFGKSPKVTRRGLLQSFALTSFGMGLAGADAFLLEPSWLDVTERRIPIPDLGSGLEGLKIAQISDLHFRSFSRLCRSLLDSLDEQGPQFVCLTGDVVDKEEFIPGLLEFLDAMRRPGRSVIAVLGNWEHWAGLSPLRMTKEYGKSGARLMLDEERRTAEGLSILATDDILYSRASLAQIARKAGAKRSPRLMLTHSPSILDMPEWGERFWDLALAGHTHGGQARLGGWIPFLPPESGRFVNGWYQTLAGPAYVSKGVGTTIMNIRFNCRPELAYFTLARG